jgi:SNF2 family DNA or RNA helicase
MADAALVSARHKSFAIPFDLGLANLVPSAKPFTHPDLGAMLLVPHTRDTTRLARNLGYTTPAPILTQYDWNGDVPFRTQKVTAALLTMQARAFVLSEMGTGKTRAALHALNYLMLTGEVQKALVVAPLSTLVMVWDREIFQYFNHLSVGVLHGSKAKRLKILAENHDVYVINHDGIETVQDALLARSDIECVIVDELADFRNARTDRWKILNSVCSPRGFVWGLTGSPTPNEPADAWGQVKLLLPNRVPKYYKQFKRLTMAQVSQFRWIARQEANEIVFDTMQPAVRYTRDECVELPEVSYQNRPVQLSAEQSRVYDELMKKLKIGFQEGTVTAANEGVLFSKLLQITCGWVYTTDRRVVSFDNQDRIDQLLEILDEAEGKVIVFVDFIHAAERLYAILAKSKIHAALVTGSTPAHARNHIFSAFKNDPVPRVLVAHPKCMAHGLTLTSANVIVWFSPTTSLETYEQACARITRPGQTKKSLIIHLTGTPVESKLYRRLQQKASLQGALLEMFESQEPTV